MFVYLICCILFIISCCARFYNKATATAAAVAEKIQIYIMYSRLKNNSIQGRICVLILRCRHISAVVAVL